MTEQARIADAIVHAGQPELRDGTGTPFDVLWAFLKESRFLYPEKLDSIRVPEVEATMTKLLGQPNDLPKTSLVVDADRIQGHVSGVRAYRHTWVMQHLAAGLTRARPRPQPGDHRIPRAAPGIEWIKIWYRPANRWPTRAFSAFARKLRIPRSRTSERTFLHDVRRGTTRRRRHDDVLVRESEPRDHALIEAYFVSNREAVPLRADDLFTSRFLAPRRDPPAYAALGLVRRSRSSRRRASWEVRRLCAARDLVGRLLNSQRAHEHVPGIYERAGQGRRGGAHLTRPRALPRTRLRARHWSRPRRGRSRLRSARVRPRRNSTPAGPGTAPTVSAPVSAHLEDTPLKARP